MSTVRALVRSSAARHRSTVSRLIISSVRSGPASTWQCLHVMLHSLPTLIWKISIAAGRRSAGKSRSGSLSNARSCARVEESGAWRETSEVVALGPFSFSFSAAPKLGHHLLVHVLEHLHAMHERRAAADRRRDMQRFGHLLQVRALRERFLGIRVDAIGALHDLRHCEGDQRLLARGQRAGLEHLAVPLEELVGEALVSFGDARELRQMLGLVIAVHRSMPFGWRAHYSAAPYRRRFAARGRLSR